MPLNIHPAAIRALAVYGPRPIATGRLEQDRWSQLLTYIRLPDAAGQRLRREPRWIFARFHLIGPRHWPKPSRSTHQVREATE